jgi:hypothetical protein
MIHYKHFVLDNGLRVYVHEDHTTPIAAVNILYNVGSKDEDESKTGFAHLFEHLMFGGSQHVPVYDEPLQRVGGENNAFTSPDITNYYITLPAVNLETAFWLESDRMMSLSFEPRVLEVQRKVGGRRVQAAVPQPALRRRVAPAAPPGLPGAPVPLGHHRQGNQPHRRRHDGRRPVVLLQVLPAQQCHPGGGRAGTG